MIRRVPTNNPCANCSYAEEWDWDDEATYYQCDLGLNEECDGEEIREDDYDIYRKENPIEL